MVLIAGPLSLRRARHADHWLDPGLAQPTMPKQGTYGTEKLREEIEAENEGVTITLAVRWLGKLAEIEERALKGDITASSVTFMVKGEEVANRLVRSGLRVMEEAAPVRELRGGKT